MSTPIQQGVWRWIAISATSAAVAALVRVVGRGRRHARVSASPSTDKTATEAALEIAGGAMSNEGGPVRNG